MRKMKIKLLALGVLATVTITSSTVFASTKPNKTANTDATIASTLANSTGTVNTDDVNLRTTPGIEDWNSYNVRLQEGDSVLVLSETGSIDGYRWYKVRVESGALKGKTGYVASIYVDVYI